MQDLRDLLTSESYDPPAKTFSLEPERYRFFFKNGYGASVVRGPGTYGGPAGLWELAVIIGSEEEFELVNDTPITDDVLGHLTLEDVHATLLLISQLPKRIKYDASKELPFECDTLRIVLDEWPTKETTDD